MEFWGGLDLPCVPLVDGCGSQLCEGFPELVEESEGLIVTSGASVLVVVATVHSKLAGGTISQKVNFH